MCKGIQLIHSHLRMNVSCIMFIVLLCGFFWHLRNFISNVFLVWRLFCRTKITMSLLLLLLYLYNLLCSFCEHQIQMKLPIINIMVLPNLQKQTIYFQELHYVHFSIVLCICMTLIIFEWCSIIYLWTLYFNK